MRKLLLSTAGLLAFGAAAAHAATITVEASDNTAGVMLITGTQSGASGSSGAVTATYGVPNPGINGDSLTISSQGIPINAGLATTTLNATGKAGEQIDVIVTEQGLTAAQASIPMQVSFTINALTGGASGSVTFSDFVSSSNANFDTSSADLLRTVTLQGSSTAATDVTNQTATGLTPGQLYSVTQKLSFTFATAGSINASSQLLPATTTVPEPASMALLGAGLFGIGMVRRRARKG